MVLTVGFPIYVTSVLSFIGWLVLCFFLPTGMWGLPFDYIGAYMMRPRPMREDEFKR